MRKSPAIPAKRLQKYIGGHRGNLMERKSATNKDGIGKWFLIGISVLFFLLMLVLPLIEVIYRSLKDGWELYCSALTAEYTLSALGRSFMDVIDYMKTWGDQNLPEEK